MTSRKLGLLGLVVLAAVAAVVAWRARAGRATAATVAPASSPTAVSPDSSGHTPHPQSSSRQRGGARGAAPVLAAPQTPTPDPSSRAGSGSAGIAASMMTESQVIDMKIDEAFRALDDGNWDAARAAARDCLGRNPNISDCQHALVYSFTRKGEYTPELVQTLGDCLALDPKDPECLETSIIVRLKAGDLAGARRALAERNAIPDFVPDYVGAAEVALASGDRPEACKQFAEACRLSQEYACAMVKTGCPDVKP